MKIVEFSVTCLTLANVDSGNQVTATQENCANESWVSLLGQFNTNETKTRVL